MLRKLGLVSEVESPMKIRICLEIQMEMGDHDPDRGSELGVVELVANVRGNEATTN